MIQGFQHIPQMRRKEKLGMLSASATYHIPTKPLQSLVMSYGNKKTKGIGENSIFRQSFLVMSVKLNQPRFPDLRCLKGS